MQNNKETLTVNKYSTNTYIKYKFYIGRVINV